MDDVEFYKLIEICVGFGLENIPDRRLSDNECWLRLKRIRHQLEMRARFAAACLEYDQDVEAKRDFYELLRAAVDDGKKTHRPVQARQMAKRLHRA